MNKEKNIPAVDLKEGYWLRLDDESYAVHKVLSVTITEQIEPTEDFLEVVCTGGLLFGSIGLAIFAGVKAGSWIVGLVVGVPLFLCAAWLVDLLDERKSRNREVEKERQGFPSNVSIELDKKGPRIVATAIPKVEAERLRIEIESIVANAARTEAEKTNTEQSVARQPT